jgi:uncharacterized damage-inducible protein DinB
MDVREYIQKQIAQAHRLVDGAMTGLTDEQLNWLPPGTANTISATVMHILGGEDNYIQGFLQGKPTLFAEGGWAAKIGVAAPPRPGQSWDEYKSKALAVATLLAFQQVVREATERYLAGITTEDLDRVVTMGARERSVAEVLTMLVGHLASHAGEVAALKGVQGAKGLPF